MADIVITEAEIRDFLEAELEEEKPSDQLVKEFTEYVKIDISEWLRDNFRSFSENYDLSEFQTPQAKKEPKRKGPLYPHVPKSARR